MDLKRETAFILALLFLCYLLFFFRLGTPPLWDTDEGMHAATSKGMVQSGDWITPTLNGERFYDKPALYNWFVSFSFLVFGFNEFSARLPSALLGTGCVLLVYLIGRTMAGSLAGFLSGVVLATSGEQVILSRAVVHDMALAFFVSLALYFFYLGIKDGCHRKKYFLLFYASVGFAVLAKGPIGALLPSLVIGFFLLVRRRPGLLKELIRAPGSLRVLAIAAPWYVLIILKNREYGPYFFMQQNLMNFVSAEARHHAPVSFYVPVLAGGFFPWFCFLPLALFQGLKDQMERREGTIFLTIWFVVIFVFFSTASSKLPTYLLPLFPAASCLVGLLWHDLLKDRGGDLHRRFIYCFLLLLGISVFAIGYVWFQSFPEFKADYGLDMTRVRYFGMPMLGVLTLSFGLFAKKRWQASLFALTGALVSCFVFIFLVIVPMMNPYRSTKGLALSLDRLLSPGQKLVFVRVLRDSALFYTNREAVVLMTRKELTRFLNSPERVFCVIRKSLFEKNETWRRMAYIIAEEGHKVLVSNKE